MKTFKNKESNHVFKKSNIKNLSYTKTFSSLKLILSVIVLFISINSVYQTEVLAVTDKEYSCNLAYSVEQVVTNNNYKQLKCFATYQEAANYFNSIKGTTANVVIRTKNSSAPNKIVAMDYGYAIASSALTVNVYKSKDFAVNEYNANYTTYVTQNTKLYYYGTEINSAGTLVYKVAVSGFVGYISSGTSDLLPWTYVVNDYPFVLRSGSYAKTDANYYRVINDPSTGHNEIRYYSSLVGAGTSTFGAYGIAPSWLPVGTYYSDNANQFYKDFQQTQAINNGAKFYNYFQYLPLRTRSNLTGADLDRYLAAVGRTDSVYYGKSSDFIYNQNNYGMNGLLIFAMANLESAYGTSYYAKNRYNLFGWNAVDSNPDRASYFDSVSHSIKEHMSINLFGYLDLNDYRFGSAAIGNKGSGLNRKYASDPDWGLKIAAIAYQADKYNGYKDYNYYTLGVLSDNTNTNVYSQASTSSSVYYSTLGQTRGLVNQTVAITKAVGNFYETTTWWPIISGKVQTTHNGGNYLNNVDTSVGYISKNNVTVLNTGQWTALPAGVLPTSQLVNTTIIEGESATFKVLANPTVNVRKQPSTSSDVIGTLALNTEIKGTYVNNNTWVKITYNNQVGYGSADWLQRVSAPVEPEPTPDPIPEETVEYRVTATAGLNVRSKPDSNSTRLGTLAYNFTFEGSLTSDGKWVKFTYNGQTAYVSSSYVEKVEPTVPVEPDPEPTPEPTPEPKIEYRVTATAGLIVRAKPDTSSTRLGSLAYNSTFEGILTSDGKWIELTYQKQTGYVSAEYVEKVTTQQQEVDVAKTLGYTLTGSTLTGMNLTTKISSIEEKIKAANSSATVTVVDSQSKSKSSSSNLATGDTITITQNGKSSKFTIAVKGDINGDGVINSSDYVAVANHILSKKILSGANMVGADINGDSKVNSSDYVAIANHILGKSKIHK